MYAQTGAARGPILMHACTFGVKLALIVGHHRRAMMPTGKFRHAAIFSSRLEMIEMTLLLMHLE
jgi:hypothetical protein